MRIKRETLYEFAQYFTTEEWYPQIDYECYLGGDDNYIGFNADNDGEPIIVCGEKMYDRLCNHQKSIERNQKINDILNDRT